MNNVKQRLVAAILIVGFIVAVRFSGVDQYFSFEYFKASRFMLLEYVEAHYLLSVLIFITVYILAVALSVPGAVILTLAGGFLFSYAGVIYVNIGATLGAVIVFLLARYILGNWIQEKYADRLQKFNNEMETHGYNYLLTLRLIPVFPFFLINLLAGVTTVRLFTFFWTTMIGIIPGSFVYAFAGKQLGSLNSLSGILSVPVISAFILLALLAQLPLIINKLKARKK